MSTTQLSTETTTKTSTTALPQRLEVVVVPVADVDRSKRFYESLGWRLDADIAHGDYHAVQMTPPGSNASIIFGNGVTDDAPGSVGTMLLAVDDIETARAELIAHGVDVTEVFHDVAGSPGAGFIADTSRRAPGLDPERRSYASYARFSDPDGNGWMLQEVTERLPGRVEIDVAALAELLHETAEHHDTFEKAAPPHDWWDWYAAYFGARQNGSTPEQASATADRYMAEVKGVIA